MYVRTPYDHVSVFFSFAYSMFNLFIIFTLIRTVGRARPRLTYLYELEVGKLMYDAIRNTLPTPLSFLYIPNSTVHSHNTRQRHEPHVQARRSMVATNSLTHRAHGIWSATPHQIKELDTRSKFKRSLKREMLTKYKLHM